MLKSEVVVNIEDIYYNHDEENVFDKKLLKKDNSNCCYSFLDFFLCCFL